MSYSSDIFTWQRVPVSDIRFKRPEEENSFLLGYAIFYIFIGYVIGILIQQYPRPMIGATQFNQDAWYAILFRIFFLLTIPTFVYFGLWKYRMKDLLLGIKPNIRSVLATMVMTALGFFLNASHLSKISSNIHEHPDASLRVAVGVIMPLLTAGIPEEFFFCGYLQTPFGKKMEQGICHYDHQYLIYCLAPAEPLFYFPRVWKGRLGILTRFCYIQGYRFLLSA